MELSEILSHYQDHINNTRQSLRLHTTQVGVEPIFEKDVTDGGIIIPSIAKGRCTQGIVKALGPDVENVRIGDYVIFSGYNGDLIAIEDELFIVMLESQLAGVYVDSFEVDFEGERYPVETLIQAIKKAAPRNFKVTNPLDSRDRPV